MDRYPKLFILFSLIYFGIGAILGLAMGTLGHESLRFAHVHLNLLGFMSMMIYGVGYFILPRFNATTLRWPQWVGPQFWLANIGLIGMIFSNYAYYSNANQVARTLFGLFASLEALAIVMFVLNLIATIFFVPKVAQDKIAEPSEPSDQAESFEGSYQEQSQEQVEQAALSQEAEQVPVISPDMPVGEIVEKWEATIPVLVEAGFQHLANPEARQMVKRVGVTLRAACERHGLDLEEILAELEETIKREQSLSKSPQTKVTKTITGHEIIGDVLKRYPSTREVFRKYYGEGCFTCPGQAMESVAQSAMMHNVALEKFLTELNREAENDVREKAAV